MPRSEGNITMPPRRRLSLASGDCRLPKSVSPATARNAERVQPFDKARRAIRLMGLHHLHHKLASAQALARFLTGAQPGRTVVAPATRVRAHVRRAAKTRDAALGGRRAVALRVDLQRAAD